MLLLALLLQAAAVGALTPWQLEFLPAPQLNGFRDPQHWSLGGGVVVAGGEYHLFASSFAESCGIGSWGTNSVVIHAVGHSVLGPFTYKERSLPSYHHKVQPIRAPTGEFLLFSNGMFPEPAAAGPSLVNCSGTMGGADVILSGPRPEDSVETLECWWSDRVDGPWRPVLNKNDKTLNGRNLFHSTNPTPFFEPNGNGTLYVFGHNGTSLTVSVSHNWRDGSSYSQQRPLVRWLLSSSPDFVGEDPVVWFDARLPNAEGGYGAWRCLFNSYNHSDPHNQSRVGGYGQSAGHSVYSAWTVQSWATPAYTNNFTSFISGSSGLTVTERFQRRERPKIFCDPQTGAPIALYTGVCPAHTSRLHDCYTIAAPLAPPEATQQLPGTTRPPQRLLINVASPRDGTPYVNSTERQSSVPPTRGWGDTGGRHFALSAMPHGGVGVQVLSCNSSTGFQRWTVRPDTDNATLVSIRLGADSSACLHSANDGHGNTVWVEACSNSTTDGWVLRPALAGDATRQITSVGAFLLVHAASGLCASVRGCCDSSPLALADCTLHCRQPDTGHNSPPADCLMHHNKTTGQLRTVASDLCLDGGTMLPAKGCTDPIIKQLPFCNTTLSNRARAVDLAGRLTLQEQASGVLAMLMVPTSYPDNTPYHRNLRQSAGVARLGIPPIMYNEALHGVMADCLPSGHCPTIWPIHILQSAAFNRTMWRTIATQIGTEGRALYNARLDAANFWGPDVNPYRDPRYGRGQETPGEDAWVNAQVAVEYVLGLQGGPAGGRVGRLQATAACKHILLYDGQSGTAVNATIRDLMDYYMVPWHGCAVRGHSASMMCSYGAISINGSMVPDCGRGDLINGVIREKWNWTGFVVSDCDAINNIEQHLPGIEPEAAAAFAMNGGVDLDCGPFYQNFLAPAVTHGLVSKDTVMAASVRVLEHQIALGTFDATTPYDDVSLREVGSADHAALARESAAQSIVLLKNDRHYLPLPPSDVSVAVIGPHSRTTTELLGAYANSDNRAVQNNTMLIGAQRRLGIKHVTWAQGCSGPQPLDCPDKSGFAAATAAAKKADIAVVFLGISNHYEGEGRDRHDLALPGNQVALALACIAANPKTVVVLIHGGMVNLDEIASTGASILTALYPGQAGGDAVWDVLTGVVAPAGKLPYTWYKTGFEKERGRINDQDLRAGFGITYRYYRGAPLFAYGHGLSYTTFRYQWGKMPPTTQTTAAVAAGFSLSVLVTNEGATASDVVVLVFGSFAGRNCPLKTLVGFSRVALVQPGACVAITVDVDPRTLGCVDDDGVRTVPGSQLVLEAGDIATPATHTIPLTGPPFVMPV